MSPMGLSGVTGVKVTWCHVKKLDPVNMHIKYEGGISHLAICHVKSVRAGRGE